MYFGLEGDVGVVEVHPVAHFLGQVVPLGLEAHHGFAAALVVVLDADFVCRYPPS